MINKGPKVSVLIPSYGSEKYIKTSIESILNQTYSNFELIILDDCSPDNSNEIIETFSDERISFYKNDRNLGISKSRNKLLELAQGKYIAIMDCDDISLPNRLEKEVTFMELNQNVSMIGAWGELFNNTEQRTFFEKIKRFVINLGLIWCQMKNPTLEDMLQGNVMMHSSMMLRTKDMIEHNILYNEKYSPAEDFDIVKQAMFKGLKVANIQEVLFRYNLHGNNFSLQKKDKMRKVDEMVKRDVAIHLGKKYKKYPYFMVVLKKLRLKMFVRKNND
ncbi:MAG: glycosyltransferase family 2 protein [Alphaproteobacteria bacterium]